MISFERALNSIHEKNMEEVREFARNRILGTDIASFGSGHSIEPSEDVVIQLLRNPEIDAEIRTAVIEGWLDVYRQLREWLDDPDYFEDIEKWKDIAINLCRVVDIAEPPEFKKYIKRLITELLDEESCPGELLGAAIKAYMAYAQDDKSIRFWEDEILTNKEVAAFGFNALLDIDPYHERIEEKLFALWLLQVKEDWPINTAFLLRRAARVRNETALIYRVLLKLKNKDYSVWERIETELKQPWNQQWLEKLKDFESPIHQETRREERESLIKDECETEPDLEVWLEDKGIGFDEKYYLKVGMRMHPIDINHYYDFLNSFLKSRRTRDKIKVIDSPEIYEEIEYAER